MPANLCLLNSSVGGRPTLQRFHTALRFNGFNLGKPPEMPPENVKPADDTLHAMGFTNVKVLYIADNFGADWVEKGYPVAKGD